ncbi:MAG: hypothetical protein U0840_10480 [Gemmataceae bacterium]
MKSGMTPQEAVRVAKEKLSDATTQEMAAFIREHLGLTIKPPIVAVLLGAMQERAALNQSGQRVYQMIEQYRIENPEVPKKKKSRKKEVVQPEGGA